MPRPRAQYTDRESGVRHFGNQVGASRNRLPWLNENLAVYGQVHLGKARQAQVGTALTLAESLTEADERSWRQAKTVAMELQNHVVACVGLHPKRIRRVIHDGVRLERFQVQNLAFNGAARGVGAETIDAYHDAMGLALQYAFVDQVDRGNTAVDRAYDTERCCGNVPARVAKNEKQP